MDVGYVAKAGEDVLPSTGPHLDVRVLKDGQYINPVTWRTGLQNLKIGKSRTPLYRQEGGKWLTPFQITSGFGPRQAPTAGASTDHKGVDYGIAGGEPLFWEGPGTFKPGQGYGSIMTPEGYEVRLLHTKGGKETTLPAVTAETPTQQIAAAAPITYNVYMRQQSQQPADPYKSFLNQFLAEQLFQQPQTSSLMSPQQVLGMLSAAAG
jgi:hypothetical protein